MSSTAKKTDPQLWALVKQEVTNKPELVRRAAQRNFAAVRR